jgi:hypothetical protein
MMTDLALRKNQLSNVCSNQLTALWLIGDLRRRKLKRLSLKHILKLTLCLRDKNSLCEPSENKRNSLSKRRN